jgi:DNA processing protein
MTGRDQSETQVHALVALLFEQEPRPTPSKLRHQFELGRTPYEILEDGDSASLLPENVDSRIDRAIELVADWRKAGISVLTPCQAEYPAQLSNVFDYPVLLFACGEVRHDIRSVAIVGSREVSNSGLRFASDLARLVTLDDVTVVSGLARGVDGSAHRAALDAGGRTVAVLGNGISYTYPREHATLQQEIAQKGLLLSQFSPDERPTRRSFPQRNITMSAYSSVTVIVEATEKSGTRIQADAAVKHGRPLVITRRVATETSWGRTYAAGAYDVTVVDSPGEARRAITRLLDRTHSTAALLSA